MYDSKEERYFKWYLDELKEYGYISHYEYHPDPFTLSSKVNVELHKQLKTKVKIKQHELLKPHTYTADFRITWTKKGISKFCYLLEEDKFNYKNKPFICQGSYKSAFSYVDVKGTYDRNKSEVSFSLNQKWVYSVCRIYINKIIPLSSKIKKGLFEKTFTPKKYLLTDSKKHARKINWNVKLIEDI